MTIRSIACVAAVVLGAFAAGVRVRAEEPRKEERVELGNFSVSLAVKDLKASRAFYEKLGFRAVHGDAAQNWLILRNGTCILGLFQGMLEKNTLTFNPGWTSEGETLPSFQDVRDLQRVLKERGITPKAEADPDSKGPAHFLVVDPDGNPILFDQHVPRPSR